MSLRLFNDGDGDEKVESAEPSVYCIMHLENTTTAFFVRESDKEELSNLVSSDSKDLIRVRYLQKVYNPIEDEEAVVDGEFVTMANSITAISFEFGEDFPKFYL